MESQACDSVPWSAEDCSLQGRKSLLSMMSMMSRTDGPFHDVEERVKLLPQYNRKKITSKYRLGKIIGEGGFSVVRKVKNKSTGKKYACKIIQFPCPDADDYFDQMSREAIFNEIEIASRVNCEHLAGVEEFFLTESEVYLVQRLMEGGMLYDDMMLRPGQRYAEEEARCIIKQVLQGLAYLHGRSVVHRDLKLENLMLSKPGDLSNIRIVDFGLSKRIVCLTTTACGTPLFIAPEILRRSSPGHGLPVDMWSVGAILYSLLAGFTPFHAEEDFDLFENIENCDYHFEDSVWNGVSQSVKDLIRRFLVLDPTQRLTARAALSHPWFHENEEQSTNADNG